MIGESVEIALEPNAVNWDVGLQLNKVWKTYFKINYFLIGANQIVLAGTTHGDELVCLQCNQLLTSGCLCFILCYVTLLCTLMKVADTDFENFTSINLSLHVL